ncbi:DUF481 domain-containing protein [Marinobacterium mangrovicola]|uniref:Putative salt-induced outer membrane protein YdiY n=1 Tax=Marinobacterium mangrovicola TaxID=1476959 RepID=A0A4R1G7K9_9GAMM|nr:DUF481 domain-containing protein [Marinobacterium mangrovicola]TCK03548.1 putative salt-induced outer membrane protein YdiY [Marinobacterium mangrovicola]
MLFYRVIALLTSCLAATAQAGSVSIELDNGDHLSGELIEQNEQSVVLNSPVLGEISVPRSNIVALDSEAALTVQLETLTEAQTETETSTESPMPETPIVDIDGIDTAEIRLALDTEEALEEDFGLFGTGWLSYWERRLDLGLAGSSGNSDSMQGNLSFTAEYESSDTRINHRINYFRAQSDHELSDHSFYASVNRDWLLPNSPWFRFAEGRVDVDQFNEWEYRINANGGVGYEFSNTPTWRVLGRTGLGFQRAFGGEDNEPIPEAMFGLETRWKMNDFQRVEFANTLYPNLLAPSEVRNLTSLDWILDLNTYMGVALKVGLSNEYNSVTDEEENNDFKYTASLAWTL